MIHPDFDLLFSDYLYIVHKTERDKIRKFASRLGGRLLDAGCGRRPHKRVLNKTTEYISLDRNKDLSPGIVGGVCEMPFKDKEFDSVICSQVIEHLREPGEALTQIARILKDSGTLYISTPMSWRLHYEPDDYFRFTRYGLEYLLNKHGFEAKAIERFGGFFSYIAVRLIDIFVLRIFFPVVSLFGIKRGKYRMAALLTMPLSIIFLFIGKLLDLLEPGDAYAWAVLAKKKAS